MTNNGQLSSEATDNHKQIAIQRLQNVRTHLALAVFAFELCTPLK